jgi:hypothetical protein
MTQSKLFEIPEAVNTETCRKCKHLEKWDFNSKIFHYCGIRKSNRTSNGKLKVKCKDKACKLFVKD